jgi:hypothetical protein
MRSPLRPPRLWYRSPPNVAEKGCCVSYSDISAHTAKRGGRISTIIRVHPPVFTPCRSPASGRGGQLDVQRVGSLFSSALPSGRRSSAISIAQHTTRDVLESTRWLSRRHRCCTAHSDSIDDSQANKTVGMVFGNSRRDSTTCKNTVYMALAYDSNRQPFSIGPDMGHMETVFDSSRLDNNREWRRNECISASCPMSRDTHLRHSFAQGTTEAAVPDNRTIGS